MHHWPVETPDARTPKKEWLTALLVFLLAGVLHEVDETRGSFNSFHLSFVNQVANEVAHRCAKQADESGRRCLWLKCIPSFLAKTLHGDCNPNLFLSIKIADSQKKEKDPTNLSEGTLKLGHVPQCKDYFYDLKVKVTRASVLTPCGHNYSSQS